MTSPAKILVVDDEDAIRLTLAEMLTRDGHEVVSLENGQAALASISTQLFDLALIDLKLGDMEGTMVLTALHHQSPSTVVIMLTAYGSLETAVTALRQGAHDYLFKPCSPVELRESIRQGLLKHQREKWHRDSLRRLAQHLAGHIQDIQTFLVEQPSMFPVEFLAEIPNPPAEERGRFLQYNRLIVDFLRHIITFEDHLLALSPTEFNLLAHLIREAPRVVTTQELVREVQGYESEPWQASEIVRAHISHLRRKLKGATKDIDIIRTVRGVGYTLNK